MSCGEARPWAQAWASVLSFALCRLCAAVTVSFVQVADAWLWLTLVVSLQDQPKDWYSMKHVVGLSQYLSERCGCVVEQSAGALQT